MNYHSLKGENNFNYLFIDGRFYKSSGLSIKALKIQNRPDNIPLRDMGRENYSSWGICIPYKLGNAVLRNRYRRICRSVIRSLPIQIPSNWHIALIPQSKFFALSLKQRQKCLLNILREIPELRGSLPYNI